jgi:large subunit ribosomal protein L25
MKKYSLTGAPRTIVGKKVKTLRAQGQLPATIYGKAMKSVSLTVPVAAFENVYKSAGETGLIELTVDRAVHPVLIHNVQQDPVSDNLLHVEFRQVDLKEKVRTKVPVEHTGECPAVAQKLGVLLSVLNEIEVEALPTDLPEKISVDISALTAVDQELKVSDLAVPAEVTILTDLSLTVVKVGPLVTKEAEAQAAADAAAAEAAAAESAPAEGEAPAAEREKPPAEGEAPAAERAKPEAQAPEEKKAA